MLGARFESFILPSPCGRSVQFPPCVKTSLDNYSHTDGVVPQVPRTPVCLRHTASLPKSPWSPSSGLGPPKQVDVERCVRSHKGGVLSAGIWWVEARVTAQLYLPSAQDRPHRRDHQPEASVGPRAERPALDLFAPKGTVESVRCVCFFIFQGNTFACFRAQKRC